VEKLPADAPDSCSNVHAITVFAAPSNETFIVYPIVDRPIGQPDARFRRQEMNDVVFPYGEVQVDTVLLCPTEIRVENKLAADYGCGRGCWF
jgi:hypothetical protein